MADQLKTTGLAGITAGETKVSSVQQTGLWYRGYSIEDLANHSTFEETAFLILNGELPSAAELDAFQGRLFEARAAAAPVIAAFPHIPKDAELMDVLRTAVSLLGHRDDLAGDNSTEANIAKAERLMGQVAEIIPAWLRFIEGKEPVVAKPGLSQAAQVLWQLRGEEPDELAAGIVDLSLILYAEHEFNASTFVARTCASTLSDMHSAICGAIGTLKGPLHGGANEKAMDILAGMSDPESARAWVMERLAAKDKIMGFGHRVYKNGDHRAVVLGEKAKEIARAGKYAAEQRDWAGIYQTMVDTMRDEKGMHPNVDFPCGLAYYLLGLPKAICTPLFVASRLSGWCAHVTEQHANNRLIRPLSEYVGPAHRDYVPVAAR